MANVKHAKPSTTAVGRSRAVLWQRDIEVRYNISRQTRINWEKAGKLPKRDVHVGGVAEGWYVATIEAAERGETVRP